VEEEDISSDREVFNFLLEGKDLTFDNPRIRWIYSYGIWMQGKQLAATYNFCKTHGTFL